MAVEAGRARFLEAGAGPAVVLVHGLGLSGFVFRGRCRALAAAGFRAVAPDLPGFGGSDGPHFGLSVPETAAWLLAFGDAIGLGRAVWLGHSLAAQAVLELAVRAPHRASALILVTPTGTPGGTRLLRQVYGLARDVAREPVSLIPKVLRQYVRVSPSAYLGTWLKAARDQPIAKAHRVQCPTLVLAGRHDPVVPDAYLSILLQRIPDARIRELHGAGHGIVFDRSDEFDRGVIEFLRTITGGSADAPGVRTA